MKRTPVKPVETDLKLWCETCCVRIAPNEERVENKGKSYHIRCNPKSPRQVKKRAAEAKANGG